MLVPWNKQAEAFLKPACATQTSPHQACRSLQRLHVSYRKAWASFTREEVIQQLSRPAHIALQIVSPLDAACECWF